ncbi:MAG: type II toxin-antitoxin system VapC family toxin [Actinomycetota bacterium]|nr:type II toxin-antitoxin system VapC family toxin [Actinomycetota bacterium]
MPADRYVLDSYAILAMLEDESGAEQVSSVISSSKTTVFMSVINLGEVLYIVQRRRSAKLAAQVAQDIVATEDIHLVDATFERAQVAAGIKARGGLAYADAFAVGLAKEIKGIILTGDREFASVEKDIDIRWL